MANRITVQLISVHDGDTFTCKPIVGPGFVGPVQQITVRIAGMDAPEAPFWNGQDAHGQPLWSDSKQYLESKLRGGTIEIEPTGKSGKRDVCKVWVAGRDIARDIVWDGWAYGDTYSNTNMDAMAQAKKAGRGMWSKENIRKYGNPVPPRFYREGPGQAPFYKNFQVRAREAESGVEIPSSEYRIFVEGKADAQKFIDIHKADVSVKVTITSDTYQTLEFTVASEQDDSKPIEVELRRKDAALASFRVTFIPTHLAENLQVTLDTDPPQTKVSGVDGVVFHNVPGGSEYSLTYSSDKVETNTQTVTVTKGMADVVIHLKGTGNGDGDKVAGVKQTEEAKPISPEFKGVPVDDNAYENGAYQGYYTSAQCRVYIGNLFLDELNTIQYSLQTNAVPLYGYCDRDPAAFAQGRALVQGQLILNYTADWYLPTALRNHNRVFSSNENDPELIQVKSEVDAARNASPEKQQAAIADAMEAVKSASYSTVKKLTDLAAQERPSQSDYSNACYWPNTFDILIEIGEGELRNLRKIEKCKITSNELILDQSGQPLYDAYGFIGRVVK